MAGNFVGKLNGKVVTTDTTPVQIDTNGDYIYMRYTMGDATEAEPILRVKQTNPIAYHKANVAWDGRVAAEYTPLVAIGEPSWSFKLRGR